MNNPFRPLADELRRIAAAGFEYVDLTLEPPGAWPVVPEEVRELVEESGLGVVGHTAWYLPVASPFPPLRTAARGLFLEAFHAFAAVGATHVTIHPDVRFHLDVGHAHLAGDTTGELLAAFGDRLAHVHVSDNFGVDDLHLPLGAGSIAWRDVIDRLRGIGYDGTVTLEMHSPEPRHLEVSLRLWREWWRSA